MKTLRIAFLSLAFGAPGCFAQINNLTQTTLSTIALQADTVLTVVSTTGMVSAGPGAIGSELYVISPGMPRGEVAMAVTVISATQVKVARGRQGAQSGFPSGSLVLIGQPNWFRDYDPSGGCTTAITFVAPHVNTKTGAQHLCSSITLSWAPGWNTPGEPAQVTAAVASAAGVILPSGPLFHVTGALAVTGFTIPVGFVSGSFTVIPDGTFTWTTAGNIALAGTAVINKALTFTWDATNSKWIPSYIA